MTLPAGRKMSSGRSALVKEQSLCMGWMMNEEEEEEEEEEGKVKICSQVKHDQ